MHVQVILEATKIIVNYFPHYVINITEMAGKGGYPGSQNQFQGESRQEGVLHNTACQQRGEEANRNGDPGNMPCCQTQWKQKSG